MGASVLDLYRAFEHKPFGRLAFSWLVCRKAPYFASIRPRVVSLTPARGEATIAHRRPVSNHLGTVHAIALCNLAEFIGGLTVEAATPRTMRWIPRGMTVQYLKKAAGTMRAVAIPAAAPHEADTGYDLAVDVAVHDTQGMAVLRARISMWISPRPERA